MLNRSRVLSRLRPKVFSPLAGSGRGGGNFIPKANLVFFTKGAVDSIGLSASDYDLVGATWQPVFFTNPTTPIVFPTFADLWAAVSAIGGFNTENVMGTEAKGVAVYDVIVDENVLIKAQKYFGIYTPPVAVPLEMPSGLEMTPGLEMI